MSIGVELSQYILQTHTKILKIHWGGGLNPLTSPPGTQLECGHVDTAPAMESHM